LSAGTEFTGWKTGGPATQPLIAPSSTSIVEAQNSRVDLFFRRPIGSTNQCAC
jgi:hypothetical protein